MTLLVCLQSALEFCREQGLDGAMQTELMPQLMQVRWGRMPFRVVEGISAELLGVHVWLSNALYVHSINKQTKHLLT